MKNKREAGARLLDLTVSNPTEALADYPQEQIAAAYGSLRDFTYSPDPAGSPSARRAIAEHYRARGIFLAPDDLVLTASTSEAYALLFKLLCDPGDQVLAPLPSYPLFEYLAAFESIEIVPYRLRYDGTWFVDMDTLRRQSSPRCRALLLVNPNNPTGSFLKRHEAEEFLGFAADRNLPIVSDEVFRDYAFAAAPNRASTLIGDGPVLTFSLNGLSKAAGMPQMKLAWIALGGPQPARAEARERLELLSDTYLSVSTPVQAALPELLRIGESIQPRIALRTARNLAALHTILQDAPAHCLHVEGGWSAIIQLPCTATEDVWITRLLEEHGVILQPGYFFDMDSEAYVVASLLTPPEPFAEGIERLKRMTGG